jgi:hypothetical protein
MADIRFRIVVNGEPLCMAGVEGYGSLSAILNWIKRTPESYDGAIKDLAPGARSSREDWLKESIVIDAGGRSAAYPSYISWPVRELQIGDEISIEILGAGESDAPIVHEQWRWQDSEPAT